MSSALRAGLKATASHLAYCKYITLTVSYYILLRNAVCSIQYILHTALVSSM